MDEIEQIRKAGANARAFGRAEFDNPYYVKSAMPAETGETVDAWSKRAGAWLAGWKIEDAIRS